MEFCCKLGVFKSFPKQVYDCRGSGALKGWLGTVTRERLRRHETNDSRTRYKYIDAFYFPYYCSAEVARPRSLQPQHFFRARCLYNDRQTHFCYFTKFIKPN